MTIEISIKTADRIRAILSRQRRIALHNVTPYEIAEWGNSAVKSAVVRHEEDVARHAEVCGKDKADD